MSVILCTAGYDHTIRFWEALSGICSRTISHPESQINRLCISPDKRFLAAAGAQDIKLYDIRSTNPAPILVFKGHQTNVTAVAFHCEGKWMVTGSEDKTVKIWDTRSGTVQRDYAHDFPVTDVVIHPNQGEIISVDRGGLLRIWDLGENECVHRLQPTGPNQKEDLPLTSVTVATDGSLLCAANTAGMVFVWRLIQDQDSTTIAPVTSYYAHNAYITRILLSPDSRHLATCSSDHFARIWRVSETLVYGTHFNGEGTYSRSSSTNGSRTDTSKTDAPASSFNMESIPLTPGEPNLEIPADIANLPRPANAFPLESELLSHQRWVWDCAFSADSAYLVTASSDHYARLFELSTGVVIRQYTGHHRSCVCVALNDYSEAR